MYIPRGRLIQISTILFIVLAILLIFRFPQNRPAWIATYWEPEFDYLPDYTKGPVIKAQSAVLLEATTGTILYAKNEHVRRPPTSTTKILTALMAFEGGRLEDIVSISRQAAGTRGSTARISSKQRIPLGELMYGLLLPSGNDAAVAIAEHLSGTEADFTEKMNARARELGALNTHFVNAHGLDHPNHYSTAFDLAMITKVALLYPTFVETVGQTQHSTEFDGSKWQWSTTNQLLFSFEGALGVKTGTTGGAGHCLVAAAARDGRLLISVVLASPNRWYESASLLEYGFKEFHLMPLAQKGQDFAIVTVKGGVHQTIQALAGETHHKVVRDADVDDIRSQIIISKITAPIRRGQKIGEIRYTLHGELIAQIPLTAANNVYRFTLFNKLLDSIRKFFIISPKEYNPP
ncbi:MAG: D-alanyl-D-alanine carboxypeptidase [Firmicutes bacterium]|nr:D-alanyl-D-alanine carboxypeptidase [Bacillota bacterium]